MVALETTLATQQAAATPTRMTIDVVVAAMTTLLTVTAATIMIAAVVRKRICAMEILGGMTTIDVTTVATGAIITANQTMVALGGDQFHVCIRVCSL